MYVRLFQSLWFRGTCWRLLSSLGSVAVAAAHEAVCVLLASERARSLLPSIGRRRRRSNVGGGVAALRGEGDGQDVYYYTQESPAHLLSLSLSGLIQGEGASQRGDSASSCTFAGTYKPHLTQLRQRRGEKL